MITTQSDDFLHLLFAATASSNFGRIAAFLSSHLRDRSQSGPAPASWPHASRATQTARARVRHPRRLFLSAIMVHPANDRPGIQRRVPARAKRGRAVVRCNSMLGLAPINEVSVPPSCFRLNLFDDIDPHTRRIEQAEPTLTEGLVS